MVSSESSDMARPSGRPRKWPRLARPRYNSSGMVARAEAVSVIVTLDADLQNDPADIPRLLAVLDAGDDVVCGWRRARHDPWLTRRLPSALANRLIRWLTGVRMHDMGCTLRAYRRDILADVHLYGDMHRYLPG